MRKSLAGVRVLELAGLAPAPFAGMMLRDHGAEVVRVDRVGRPNPDGLARGKSSVALNLRLEAGRQALLRLVRRSDVVLDPFRPGVLEALGVNPTQELKLNPQIIFARVTGYGQSGPYSTKAGHDINYLALSGSLSTFGPNGQPPVFPVNLLADFAGGGMNCVTSILLALLEREKSGRGQVIDVSMTEAVAYLSTFLHNIRQQGYWGRRGQNFLDGAAPFYRCYKTACGGFMAVGAVEPQFYHRLVEALGLTGAISPRAQYCREEWPETTEQLEAAFLQKSRQEWTALFMDIDCCVTPVLSLPEYTTDHHVLARGALLSAPTAARDPPIRSEEVGAADLAMLFATPYRDTQAPVPRPALGLTDPQFEVTGEAGPTPTPGEHSAEVLRGVGYSDDEIAAMVEEGAVGHSEPDIV